MLQQSTDLAVREMQQARVPVVGWRPVVSLGASPQFLYWRISNLLDLSWQTHGLEFLRAELSSLEQCELAIGAIATGCTAAGFRLRKGVSASECLEILKLITAWPQHARKLIAEFDIVEIADSGSVLFSALYSIRRLEVTLVCNEFGLTACSAHDLFALQLGAIRIAEPIVRLSGESGVCDRTLRSARASARVFAQVVIAPGIDEAAMLEHVLTIGFEFGEGNFLAPATISRPWKLQQACSASITRDNPGRLLQ